MRKVIQMKKFKLICIFIVLLGISNTSFAWGHGGGGGGGHWGGGGYGGGHWGGGYGGHYGGGWGGHYGGGYYGYRGGYGYGVGIGFYPSFGYPYYGYGYGGYPQTTVIENTAPPVYIQQTSPQSTALPANYWYYCLSPKGYYPYVKTCPGGWQQVAPSPPAQ